MFAWRSPNQERAKPGLYNRQSIPKKQLATVDDITPAYVFLASDAAKHFVGQCLSPNGGDVML
ncbi:MAG: hypothetical protein AB7G75_21300 [Candidatus Binatia bacterium]